MSSAVFEGSCLCKTVRYKITGTPLNFFHCHCSRCRKTHGTGHASNLIVKPDSAEWIAGESELGGYKVPEAERYRTCFCKKCGSPMPRVPPNLSIAVIPAGSLDSDAPLQPTAHIFWDSRVEWSGEYGDIPNWPEFPTSG